MKPTFEYVQRCGANPKDKKLKRVLNRLKNMKRTIRAAEIKKAKEEEKRRDKEFKKKMKEEQIKRNLINLKKLVKNQK